MTTAESIKSSAHRARRWIWENKGLLAGLFVVGVIIIAALITPYLIQKYGSRRKSVKSGFLDYMPDVPRVCPTDYRCGGVSREQVRMEKQLYSDLRESSKYALPETMTSDAYDVTADESEPTPCMIKRASVANEMPLPEGQYTPWDEIESGFLARNQKKSTTDASASLA